jgi:GT2 family glycosyltransferase
MINAGMVWLDRRRRSLVNFVSRLEIERPDTFVQAHTEAKSPEGRIGRLVPCPEAPARKSSIEVFPAQNGVVHPSIMVRPQVDGKFLHLNGQRFWAKGVTYGAFAPNSEGHQFPEPSVVAMDFKLIREAGINTILTYTVPPVSMLDQAADHGLKVIVNIPWMAYVCFLEDREFREGIRRQVRDAVASCQQHPAVLMHCVAKEIPPQIVRWQGRKRIESFLSDLCKIARDEDPTALVSYTNFPTTEYLELPFVDVYTFNLYLHRQCDFSAYLARLQHIAGELPLIMTEHGICSFRNGAEEQARFLDWQIEEIFNHGLAGAVTFSWTDPFYQDNCLVEDWGFGLVDASRRPKPSYEAVRRRFCGNIPFRTERRWPKFSVVVAFYNAARTLDGCLKSLQKLRYPDYEVIVVNDGSHDGSGEIMKRFPFRMITTANQGISAARNEGMRAATGEIIAYIDSDAKADPDWLTYLAATYANSDMIAVGGPNPVPREDSWVSKCVFRSPGGPTQVMLDDQSAEHIPGCNMSFRKWALEEIGGFDPIYTKAGDDVDVCWRLIERGYRIGFSPSAVVWHHRRPSVTAYWRQQVGYGEAESLLERKHPNKFNGWGHTFWGGRIYAPYPFFRLFGQPVIYQGLWGSAGFQTVYQPAGGGPLSFLPRAMEWHLTLIGISLLALFAPLLFILAGLGWAYTAFYCGFISTQAKLDDLLGQSGATGRFQRGRWRLLIALLNFLEPIARDYGRLKGGLTPWRTAVLEETPVSNPSRWWQQLLPFRRKIHWTYEGSIELEKFDILQALTNKLHARCCAVGWNADFEDWDLKTRRGAFGTAYVRAVVEHHGGPKRKARFSAVIKQAGPLAWAQGTLTALVGITLYYNFPIASTAAAAFLAVSYVTSIAEANRLAVTLRRATDAVVSELKCNRR